MRFLIKTLGCKVNQSESDELAAQLIEHGFLPTSIPEDADITIINTCTVTSVADAKARQLISKIIKSSDGKVIVTGCGVDNKNSGLDKFSDIELVRHVEADLCVRLNNKGHTHRCAPTPCHTLGRSRPFLKIQDGCDHRCSYCIVPLVRGGSQSISSSRIINKAKVSLKQGFKEIVLTGVDIGAYSYKNQTLTVLVKELLALQDDFRIRLSSLEPQSIDEQFLSFFAQEKRLCNHIHLPLQSGSDQVLKLMNRPYSANFFTQLCSKLKQANPDIAITTDIIVGFPGETEEDFEQTASVVKEIGFSRIHIFRYSLRQGTEAANFDNQVSVSIKKSRASELSLLANELSEKFKAAQVGKIAEVLIERSEGKYLKGKSSNYCTVYVEGRARKGQLVKVAASDYKEGKLFGKI